MLNAGDEAPDFLLEAVSGPPRSLHEQVKSGPVLIAILKISCPTCHLTLPLLNRLEGRLAVLGISQDDRESTLEFLDYFHITYPVLIDPAADAVANGYAVSAAYRIATVPSLFLVDGERKIIWSLEGFDRAAMALGLGPGFFRDTDDVPEMKPGCGSKN